MTTSPTVIVAVKIMLTIISFVARLVPCTGIQLASPHSGDELKDNFGGVSSDWSFLQK